MIGKGYRRLCHSGDYRHISGLRLSPLALGARAGTATRTLVPIDDAAFLQVVGGHLDANPIAHNRADAEFPHLAGCVSDNPVVVFKHYAETAIGQDFVDLAFESQKLFFGHAIKPIRG